MHRFWPVIAKFKTDFSFKNFPFHYFLIVKQFSPLNFYNSYKCNYLMVPIYNFHNEIDFELHLQMDETCIPILTNLV